MTGTWGEYMGWEASSQSLSRLDQERFLLNADLANLFEQVGGNYPSDVTIRRMHTRILRMRSAARKANPRTKFDRILKADVISNIDSVEAYLNYQFFWDSEDECRTTIDMLLDTIYEPKGKSVVTFLKNYVQRMDQGARDKVYRLSREANTYSYPWTYVGVKKKIVDYTRKIPAICRRFLREMDLDDCDGLDIKVMLEAGGSVGEYHNGISLMKLSPEVLCYSRAKDGSMKVRKFIFLLGAIHESGHMINDRFGRFIAHRGTQFRTETFQEISHGAMIEGVARWTETIGARWFERAWKSLHLDAKEINIIAPYLRAEQQALALPALYSALVAQQKENALADADKEMSRIVGYPAVARGGDEIYEHLSFSDMLENMNALLGFHHVDNLMRKVEAYVRKQRGKRYVRDHFGLLARGLYIGAWRPRTHERFVLDVYVPRVMDYIDKEVE